MDGRNQLPSNIIELIGTHIPPGRLIYIGLTCKAWYNALLPQIYHTLPSTIWSQSNCCLVIQKFGKYFKRFERFYEFSFNPIDFLALFQCCNNIESIHLTAYLLKFIQPLDISNVFPKLVSITFDRDINYFNLKGELKYVNELQFNSNPLGIIATLIPQSIYHQVKKLTITTDSLDLIILESIIPNLTYIAHFQCHVRYRFITPYNQIPRLFNIFQSWSKLELLKLNLSLENIRNQSPTDSNAIDAFQIPFPSNFSINQYKAFSIDVKCEEYGWSDSDEEDLDDNTSDSSSGSIYYDHSKYIRASVFTPLFTSPCIRLQELHLPRIDTTLLKQLSHSCPNLIQLTLDTALPNPNSETFPFNNLRKLNSCGFNPNALIYKANYNRVFPRVTTFSSDYSENFPNICINTSRHFIYELFPTITSVILNQADSHSHFLNNSFWLKIPESLNWTQMILPAVQVDSVWVWLKRNYNQLKYPLTLMFYNVNLHFQTDLSRYRLIKEEFSEIRIFGCEKVGRFDFDSIDLL